MEHSDLTEAMTGMVECLFFAELMNLLPICRRDAACVIILWHYPTKISPRCGFT